MLHWRSHLPYGCLSLWFLGVRVVSGKVALASMCGHPLCVRGRLAKRIRMGSDEDDDDVDYGARLVL